MNKIKTIDALRALRTNIIRNKHFEEGTEPVIIKIALATCSNASGARDTYNYLVSELEKRNIETAIIKTGCMGYCYAEPTIEVRLPGHEPVVFGYVDQQKADDIIRKYIIEGELVEGIIPVNYRTIES